MFKKALCAMCMLLSCRLTLTGGLFTSYEKYTDSRYVQTTSSKYARSAAECCLLCRNSENCGVANFHLGDRICEIRNTSTLDNKQISAALGWDMLIIAISCAPGWTKHQRSCYMVLTDAQTWNQTQSNCGSIQSGGHLANIHSQETNDFIEILLSQSDVSQSRMWIGAYRISAQDFIWTDGRIMSDGYQNWRPQQPDFSRDNEYCVHANNVTGFKWNDRSCNNFFIGVCEYELC